MSQIPAATPPDSTGKFVWRAPIVRNECASYGRKGSRQALAGTSLRAGPSEPKTKAPSPSPVKGPSRGSGERAQKRPPATKREPSQRGWGRWDDRCHPRGSCTLPRPRRTVCKSPERRLTTETPARPSARQRGGDRSFGHVSLRPRAGRALGESTSMPSPRVRASRSGVWLRGLRRAHPRSPRTSSTRRRAR